MNGEKRVAVVKPCDSQREYILCSNILSSEPDVTDMIEAITDNETYVLFFLSFAVLARQFHSTQMCFERDITLSFIMPPATIKWGIKRRCWLSVCLSYVRI